MTGNYGTYLFRAAVYLLLFTVYLDQKVKKLRTYNCG